MSKAKEVRAILAEIARLRSRARQLQKRVDAIGYLLECNTDGGMVGCGRKTFVAKGQSPPLGWMGYHDYDFGVMHLCPKCVLRHSWKDA